MYKNRMFLGIGVVSLLLISLAVFHPLRKSSRVIIEPASDFHQRHPDWVWTVNNQNAVIPITGEAAFPDYHQRHPELTRPAVLGIGASDYFQRHPELTAPAILGLDASDYFQGHPEHVVPASKDLTDYYFRHIGN